MLLFLVVMALSFGVLGLCVWLQCMEWLNEVMWLGGGRKGDKGKDGGGGEGDEGDDVGDRFEEGGDGRKDPKEGDSNGQNERPKIINIILPGYDEEKEDDTENQRRREAIEAAAKSCNDRMEVVVAQHAEVSGDRMVGGEERVFTEAKREEADALLKQIEENDDRDREDNIDNQLSSDLSSARESVEAVALKLAEVDQLREFAIIERELGNAKFDEAWDALLMVMPRQRADEAFKDARIKLSEAGADRDVAREERELGNAKFDEAWDALSLVIARQPTDKAIEDVRVELVEATVNKKAAGKERELVGLKWKQAKRALTISRGDPIEIGKVHTEGALADAEGARAKCWEEGQCARTGSEFTHQKADEARSVLKRHKLIHKLIEKTKILVERPRGTCWRERVRARTGSDFGHRKQKQAREMLAKKRQKAKEKKLLFDDKNLDPVIIMALKKILSMASTVDRKLKVLEGFEGMWEVLINTFRPTTNSTTENKLKKRIKPMVAKLDQAMPDGQSLKIQKIALQCIEYYRLSEPSGGFTDTKAQRKKKELAEDDVKTVLKILDTLGSELSDSDLSSIILAALKTLLPHITDDCQVEEGHGKVEAFKGRIDLIKRVKMQFAPGRVSNKEFSNAKIDNVCVSGTTERGWPTYKECWKRGLQESASKYEKRFCKK